MSFEGVLQQAALDEERGIYWVKTFKEIGDHYTEQRLQWPDTKKSGNLQHKLIAWINPNREWTGDGQNFRLLCEKNELCSICIKNQVYGKQDKTLLEKCLLLLWVKGEIIKISLKCVLLTLKVHIFFPIQLCFKGNVFDSEENFLHRWAIGCPWFSTVAVFPRVIRYIRHL